MTRKNFHFYLEKAQGKENIVIEKIDEIIKFKQKVKDYKIIKESFSFYHYPQNDEFNPTIFTNDENIMSGTYVSSLEELKGMIELQHLYSENNSIDYSIEYLDKEAIVKKAFSSKEKQDQDSHEYSSSEQESSMYKI